MAKAARHRPPIIKVTPVARAAATIGASESGTPSGLGNVGNQTVPVGSIAVAKVRTWKPTRVRTAELHHRRDGRWPSGRISRRRAIRATASGTKADVRAQTPTSRAGWMGWKDDTAWLTARLAGMCRATPAPR